MLNKPTNAAANLLVATVNEMNTAIENAKNRLAGKANASAEATVTPEQVADEADPLTLAKLQGIILLADCEDVNAANAAIKALTPAPKAAGPTVVPKP
jgi:hypothetical protein